MAQSQAEIKAIQEKLRAIQVNRQSGRGSLPAMVEMTPNSATATATRPRDSARLAADVERLQHQYASYLRQLQSTELLTPPSQTPQTSPPSMSKAPQTQSRRSAQATSEEQFAQALQRLEMQAQRINDLSAAQETAMLEWKAIAEKLERDRKGVESDQDGLVNGEDSRICEYLNTVVPYVERDEDGSFVLTARSVDLFRAEREATAMAQTLRHRGQSGTVSSKGRGGALQKRRNQSSDLEAWARVAWERVSSWINAVATPKANPSLKTRRSRQTQASAETIAMPAFSLQDAGMWVLGSVIVRVALDLFLVANPGMWFPVIALIATPAAIAVYRATVAPQSGLVWGYRLFLIMIGLLLGGRL